MPKRSALRKPNAREVRFVQARSPDRRVDHDELTPAPEATEPSSFSRSPPDPLGRTRVLAGFELATCSTPSRFREGVGLRPAPPDEFPGEAALSPDLFLAIGAFLAELPDDAALHAEYVFKPAGPGGVSLRFRLLVESQMLAHDKAVDQALALAEHLAPSLRVLADWYSFKRCTFTPADDSRWMAKRTRITSAPQALPASRKGIGFTGQAAEAAGGMVLPRRASRNPAPGALDVPLLQGTGRCCLVQSLRAARAFKVETPVRLTMRRRHLPPASLDSLRADVTGMPSPAAQHAVDLLIGQPECLEAVVEAGCGSTEVKAWLRLLAGELFPQFAFHVESQGGRTPSFGKHPRHDFRHAIAPGARPIPLLPAPAELEALGFPVHFANPAVEFPDAGVLLGQAQVGGVEIDVKMPAAGRSRHTYLLGATGTGKSTLLYNMIVQDIRGGHGLAMLDPHGDLFDQVLAAVPPSRAKDVLVIDPSDARFCPSLNPLGGKGRRDYFAACRVVNDLLDMFSQWYDMRAAGGPGFEDYFRNGLLLAAAAPTAGPEEPPESVPTIASLGHIFRDSDWREFCITKLDEAYGEPGASQVRNFWNVAKRVRGDHELINWAPYVTSKLSRLTSNATLRKLMVSPGQVVNFRAILDNRKLLFVNLGKGDLGSADSRLVGMLLTNQLFRAALSRADLPREERTPYYLYLDEFQNFIGSDIAEMLAESRKYGLALVLANQTLAQLVTPNGDRSVLNAVIGNVASRAYLRVGHTEAQLLASEVLPHFDDRVLMQLPDRHAIGRLQMSNQPSLPFVFRTLPPIAPTEGCGVNRSLAWAAANMHSS